jgi:uncharacterized phage protein (TIGR02216 family)
MGLSPEIFWSMTMIEWNAAVAGWQARHKPRAAAPLARREFDEMMKAHPDG